MKISELSLASQIPVPTIKFYIREGLLPAGRRTQKNQAQYDSTHVERLALIRALQEGAGLRLDTIARALHAADSAKEDFVIAAIDALERPVQTPVDKNSSDYATAERTLSSVIKRRSWKLGLDDISVRDAIQALTVILRSFGPEDAAAIDSYAEICERFALLEIPDDWNHDTSRDATLHYALLGTVLFEPLILALRRMAHVARTRKVVRTHKPRRRK